MRTKVEDRVCESNSHGGRRLTRCPGFVVVVSTNNPEAIFPVQRLNLGILKPIVSYCSLEPHLDQIVQTSFHQLRPQSSSVELGLNYYIEIPKLAVMSLFSCQEPYSLSLEDR